jgi:DMSO reductase family type II enzyme molybdopterin subunit
LRQIVQGQVSRRRFLKATGSAVLVLSLTRLGYQAVRSKDSASAQVATGEEVIYRTWEDVYRQKWRWDKVTYGTHLVDCYPGSCSWRVYTKDGVVWREEQACQYPQIEDGVPDMNPRGCQKGACFSQVMYGAERLPYPLKRVGERGSGRWQRISWDQALTEVADGLLDAVQEGGPESIMFEFGPGEGGVVHGALPAWRLIRLMGATTLDNNSLVNDYNFGLGITFGKYAFVSSVDDWYKADLVLVWHMNPVITKIPCAHYVTEVRYGGGYVVSIAPDLNASSIHADLHLPVKPGTDAALALAMCKVIVDERLYNDAFMKEQTDLPLLVRSDSRRFLRQTDLEEDGREDQFYFFDSKKQRIAKASRSTLRLGKVDPALEGTYRATLADGSEVEVRPVFELLKERLRDYDIAGASRICDISANVINDLAHRVAAAERVHILQGFNACKYYHGDLMERSMALLLALTGNFGRPGTGMRGANTSPLLTLTPIKDRPGFDGFLAMAQLQAKITKKIKDRDPTMTEEMVAIELEREEAKQGGMSKHPMSGMTTPAAFFWYWHCGYKDVWNRPEWNDPTMRRPFDDYLREAVEKWWGEVARPAEDQPPRMLLEVAASCLRRTRGGPTQLLDHLWPKLKTIATVDIRMSTTACFSDIVLPAAGHYEKVDFRFPTWHIGFLTFTDKAVEPYSESKPEWEIFCLLAKKVEERARQRGLAEYQDRRGQTYRLDDFYHVYTMEGRIKEKDEEKLAEDMVLDTVRVGALPERTDLKKVREKGVIRFTGLGGDAIGLNVATTIRPDETVSPLRWHTERKLPYPTLTRRIQFYIDHEWFLEAGEELPVHKPNPKIGGDYPLRLVSAHQRSSIHSIWTVQKLMLYTHRGRPTLFINPRDAEGRGIAEGDEVRVFNDHESFHVHCAISSAIQPGEVIIYHAFEPYQYRDWKSYDVATPGMVKWLHLAAGYGHLNYWRWNWQPMQVDRGTTVEVEKA